MTMKVSVETRVEERSITFILWEVYGLKEGESAITATTELPSADHYDAVRKVKRGKEVVVRQVVRGEDPVTFIVYYVVRKGTPIFDKAFVQEGYSNRKTKVPRSTAEEVLKAVGVPVGGQPAWQDLLPLLGFVGQSESRR
jgi:hypothetical protein